MYINGTLLDYTDETGNFQLELPFGTESVTIRFEDPFGGEFITKIYSKTFPEDASGIFYDTVYMQRLPEPITINSTEENLINITTSSDNVVGTIIVPENAMYDENGDLYEVRV